MFTGVANCSAETQSEAFTLVDAQKYLLRQRRTRTWGCVQVAAGSQTSNEFGTEFTRVMRSLQTDIRFKMEDSFLQGLPSCVPEGRQKTLIDQCIEHHSVSCQRIYISDEYAHTYIYIYIFFFDLFDILFTYIYIYYIYIYINTYLLVW